MPHPLTTVCLVTAAILAGLPDHPYRIIALVFLGLAVANECLRIFSLRPAQGGNGQYTIQAPGRTRTVPSPLVPPEYDGS